jgi:hypothetical protein
MLLVNDTLSADEGGLDALLQHEKRLLLLPVLPSPLALPSPPDAATEHQQGHES